MGFLLFYRSILLLGLMKCLVFQNINLYYLLYYKQLLHNLKKGSYYLYVEAKFNNEFRLIAPVKGNMNKDIFESISSSITLTLKKKDKVIFSDISINCGLEIVKE